MILNSFFLSLKKYHITTIAVFVSKLFTSVGPISDVSDLLSSLRFLLRENGGNFIRGNFFFDVSFLK